MSETQPAVINVLYNGSDLVDVTTRGAYADTVVVVTDKTNGNVMNLAVDDAWYLSTMAEQAVRQAVQPTRTPEEEAPYSGPCPEWCEVGDGHRIGEAWMDAHFARRGGVKASMHVDEEHNEFVEVAEVMEIDLELFQECVGNQTACVSLFTEWPDDGVRLTADEAELLGRKLLEASAELREHEARGRAAKRVPVAAGR